MQTDGRQGFPTDTVVDDGDEHSEVDLSSGAKKPVPSTENETLTKEQAEKLANERHSKLDKRIAELERETKQQATQTTAAEARARTAEESLLNAQRRADEAERQGIGESPDAISLFEAKLANRQAQAALAKERAALDAERATHAEEIQEARTYRTTKLADEVASEYGVDSSLLTSLTDGTREKMEKLAKVLPKKEAGDNKPNLTKPPAPDSGRRSAISGRKTVEQLSNMSMDEYAAYAAERDKNR